MASIGVCFN